MASPIIYVNGAGGVTGGNPAIATPLYVLNGGHVWYVSSATGVDAAGRGKEREKPLATLSQACTNAATGDQIQFLANHAETIAVAISLSGLGKALTIVSEGTGSSRARLTCGAAIAMLTMGTGSSINNVWFPASTGAAPTTRIDTASGGVTVDNCYFECGTFDTNRSLRIKNSTCQVKNTTFVAVASQPAIAMEVDASGGVITQLYMQNVVFDGGSFGFSDFAFKHTGASAISTLYADNISLLNNADVQIANASGGVWMPGTCSASARFEAS